MNVPGELNPRQKAAVIVRLLADDDELTGLDRLDQDAQSLLAHEMAAMDLIDKDTRDAVVAEFCDSLESVGIVFPNDLNDTIEIIGDKLSGDITDRLKRLSAIMGQSDPWERIAALPDAVLRRLAESESAELIAAMLSRLPVARASDIFASLSRDRARLVAQTVALAGEQGARSLQRIGQVLLQAAEAYPDDRPEPQICSHLGEMLNFATADFRDDMLGVMADEDEGFAEAVRRAIFIFAHIPDRLQGKDVARVVREINNEVLICAMAGQSEEARRASEFILDNISSRMATTLREELELRQDIRPKQAERAGTEVVAVIRRLVEDGEIRLTSLDED